MRVSTARDVMILEFLFKPQDRKWRYVQEENDPHTLFLTFGVARPDHGGSHSIDSTLAGCLPRDRPQTDHCVVVRASGVDHDQQATTLEREGGGGPTFALPHFLLDCEARNEQRTGVGWSLWSWSLWSTCRLRGRHHLHRACMYCMHKCIRRIYGHIYLDIENHHIRQIKNIPSCSVRHANFT